MKQFQEVDEVKSTDSWFGYSGRNRLKVFRGTSDLQVSNPAFLTILAQLTKHPMTPLQVAVDTTLFLTITIISILGYFQN